MLNIWQPSTKHTIHKYDTFKTLSLDAPMGGTDLRRIDLLVAPEPYEPEEDEEDDPDTVMLWADTRVGK
ncbi:hypothetical protein LB519_26660 [Mesorhizobium sp. AD1-1]|uniref:hypothetical protein n=1 Tax=Mesorhizobium sp. AD1-1 TaxID=2876621 RepID=UPI001CCE74D6|nr:hypothetical protein [Mesorhizobium sp. AD1-1]MBZ9721430.1 hypothetical protein [Mesorhizobium sp. AD1-1]